MSIADKAGKYDNFTGTIKWKGTEASVGHSDFTLNDTGCADITFGDVVFIEGTCFNSHIKNGLNLGCNLIDCKIDYNVNKAGKLYSCDWHDGIFEGGEFIGGIWRGGMWLGGTWTSGIKPSDTAPTS